MSRAKLAPTLRWARRCARGECDNLRQPEAYDLARAVIALVKRTEKAEEEREAERLRAAAAESEVARLRAQLAKDGAT